MAPVKLGVLSVGFAESFEHSAQSPDMLASYEPDTVRPSFVAVLARGCFGFDQCISPLEDNATFFPIGFASELVPSSYEGFRSSIGEFGRLGVICKFWFIGRRVLHS